MLLPCPGPRDQDVGREPDAQAMACADRDRGEPVQKPVENRGRALAESLADARPEAERRTAGQGESAHDTDSSGGRERAEVVAVDFVPKRALARLVEAGELEVDPAAVGQEQPVERDREPALVRVLNGPGRADDTRAARGSGPAGGRPNRTGPRPWRAPVPGNRP